LSVTIEDLAVTLSLSLAIATKPTDIPDEHYLMVTGKKPVKVIEIFMFVRSEWRDSRWFSRLNGITVRFMCDTIYGQWMQQAMRKFSTLAQ